MAYSSVLYSLNHRSLSELEFSVAASCCRSNATQQAVDRGTNYEWPGATSWACYRPDADVLVPVYSPYGHTNILSPFAADRNISLLMRFDYPLRDGKSLVAHHGHRLRKELITYWEQNPLEGSDLGVRSTKVNSKPVCHLLIR